MELRIKCSGYEIAADWHGGADENKVLIVLPGFSSTKDRQRAHAEAMVRDTGTCALVVDLSGHGNSPFELRETRPAQHLLELIYVFDWLAKSYPKAVISVSGSSYGGFLAVQLTKYRSFANLILRAPAIYRSAEFYDLWAKQIDNKQEYEKNMLVYRQNIEALSGHPLLSRASSFKGNVLVVVHADDEVIPHATTDAYIDAFQSESFLAEGFTHSIDRSVIDDARFQDYQNRIASWLNKI